MNATFRLALGLVISASVTSLAAAQDSTLTLIGTIVDSLTGEPLAQVEVYIPDASTAWTNRNGRFTLSGVRRAEPLLFMRRIGFRKRTLELSLAGSGSRIELGQTWLSPIYFTLDTVRVEADLVRTNPKLSEFYRRRKSGMGQYITASDIWKRNPMFTTDLFRSIAGVVVRCNPGAACTPMTFMRGNSGRMCPMRVILDGMPVRNFELDLISPNWIAGIEVYKSAPWTPLELGKSGCGTVVVWTGGER